METDPDAKIYYITRKKLKELKKEYDDLLLADHNKEIGEAPKIFESDTINPEFISFQEDLGFLKSRISELKTILDNYEIIKKPQRDKQDIISVGAKVRIEIDGEKDDFLIVGTLEANPALGKISNESPVGRALLGHKVGDEITISSPIKTAYKVKNIKYEIS